ncbi:MAG: ribonuclease III [Xanthobacteraceae bacterium]|nr:ribonuclease III [Xanthobacteraceae bacterium]MBX3550223.1 ribonuclease III [Xanthobacteraceae bacterium]
MKRKPHELSALEERLGYRFKDAALLAQALTHKSAVTGRKHASNQRMEFLGDRVLGLAVAEMLYGSFPGNLEGELSQRHTALVRNETCVEVALLLGLGAHLNLGQGERNTGGERNHSILGDACEAVIGAIFLDGGYQPSKALIERYWRPLMQASAQAPRDAKALLQEWALGRGLPVPHYREVDRSGPDHKPVFRVALELPGILPVEGVGPSKRDAEKAAASMMLAREGVLADPHE